MDRPPIKNSNRTSPGPHTGEDLCRDLLNGFLSADEKDMALAHIAACSACERFFAERVAERERLLATRALRTGQEGGIVVEKLQVDGVRAQAEEGPLVTELQEDLRKSRGVVDEGGRPVRIDGGRGRGWAGIWASILAVFRRPRYGFALGMTAAVVVLLVILWPRQQEGPASSLRWIPTSSGGLQMRAAAEAAASDQLAEGFDAYSAHDVARAIELLQGTEASGQLETHRRVFLGSALAMNGEYVEAVQVLTSVRARTLPDPWGSEARWTLYIALRESGQRVAADSLLRILASERGDVGDRARSIR